MVGAEKNTARPGEGEAANHRHYANNSSASIPSNQRRRLPAFGRELVDAQRAGRNVPWLLIALDWNLGRGFPRLVVPVGLAARDLDMRLARGLSCMVAHRGEGSRALDVAEATLLAGALACPIFDAELGCLVLATAEVIAARGMVNGG